MKTTEDLFHAFSFREVDLTELPLLLQLYQFEDPVGTEQLAQTAAIGPLLEHFWIFGVWLNKELIGASQIIRSKQPNIAVIFDTAIRTEHRNKGVGSKLLRHRRQFLQEQGITQTVSTIAPWNGTSLNLSLNKNGGKGTRYFRDCCGIGEDRIEVFIDLERNPETANEQNIKLASITLLSQEEFLESPERLKLEQLLNVGGYQAIRIVKPGINGSRHACLILKKGGDGYEPRIDNCS